MPAPYFTPAERAECFGPWAERDTPVVDGCGCRVPIDDLPVITNEQLRDLLDRTPVVSEELRRQVANRRWR